MQVRGTSGENRLKLNFIGLAAESVGKESCRAENSASNDVNYLSGCFRNFSENQASAFWNQKKYIFLNQNINIFGIINKKNQNFWNQN